MAVNVTKTSHFTGSAGNPISFSQIRAAYGGDATNIKASAYLRNDDAAVDWNDESTITSRVPDATENVSVATDNDWSVDSLRNTISNYLVTQSGTDTEMEFSDSNTATWNNNLSKNVPKTFDVTGIVHADNVGDDALKFYGDLYNLEIEVSGSGAVYGEGGAADGGTTSINETVNITDVQGAISTGTFTGGSITVTRYNDGVTGTEGHPVGSIGYFIDVNNISGANISVASVNPSIRGSGLIASDNSIALSTGYPQTITSTRFKVAFDMTNSQAAGRQATYVRSFFINITGTGTSGGNGGDALYVNNTYTQRDVEIRSYGKIWAGGGGGTSGNSGNSGSSLSCKSTSNVTRNTNHNNKYGGKSACHGGEYESTRNPIGHIRNRCRSRGWRRGQGWNQYKKEGYHCGTASQSRCKSTSYFNVGGGSGGNGGSGGKGRGWSNRNLSMNQSPHKGSSGNSGNSNFCGANGNSSTGNSGNSGNSGGDWGISSSGSAGRAIQKKGAQVNYYTDNTVKGQIKNI
tara:strand:+ start:2739 stop:4292 length:1554 start_codon:yes stop_codon:yes gene_type:complete